MFYRDRSACNTYIFREVLREDDEVKEGASHMGMVQEWIPHNLVKPNEDFELRNNQVIIDETTNRGRFVGMDQLLALCNMILWSEVNFILLSLQT